MNSVSLKKSHLETFNQYLNNVLNSHSIQFLKLSVQNIEENVTSRAAIFRIQRDESSGCDVTFCWMILTQKSAESLASPPGPSKRKTFYIVDRTRNSFKMYKMKKSHGK